MNVLRLCNCVNEINHNTSTFHLQAREFISKFENLKQTHIFAKIENIEVRNFGSILAEL